MTNHNNLKVNSYYIYNYYFKPMDVGKKYHSNIDHPKSTILKFIKYCDGGLQRTFINIPQRGTFNHYPIPENYDYYINSIDIVDSKYLNHLEILDKVKSL